MAFSTTGMAFSGLVDNLAVIEHVGATSLDGLTDRKSMESLKGLSFELANDARCFLGRRSVERLGAFE